MKEKPVHGVYAAALTPRESSGGLNLPAFRRVLEFLLHREVSSFALNGATGEFCLSTPEQLRVLLIEARKLAGGNARFLCGVGAAGVSEAITLAQIAEENGADGLLLPMPYFFPYAQDDLEEFCRSVAGAVDLPILLYNLPQFSSGLKAETVCKLIDRVPNIVGIKDSSGSLDILRYMTLKGTNACRIVGNDSALVPALHESVCDGVVSGVACVLPELIQELYRAGSSDADSTEFQHSSELLQEFLYQLEPLPTPWGLKWIAEARGILEAAFAQPVSRRRHLQGDQLKQWFKSWHPNVLLVSQ